MPNFQNLQPHLQQQIRQQYMAHMQAQAAQGQQQPGFNPQQQPQGQAWNFQRSVTVALYSYAFFSRHRKMYCINKLCYSFARVESTSCCSRGLEHGAHLLAEDLAGRA